MWLTANQTSNGVTLLIRDNGPGFSEQALAHAREPFFTTKASTKGLGLGLAICDTLLRTLGGGLELSNHPDGGALVKLNLLHGVKGAAQASLEESFPERR
jgi:two-component system C4-dicarboxylate transport sensor histidine kinase DctB